MAHVLLTGASGFIGTHLARALAARGDRVTCLVRKTSKVDHLKPLGVTLCHGDVTEPESLPAAIDGKTVVYHLAGLTKALNRAQLHRVNEDGVRNVARACARQTTPPVMVLVSSLAAAGPSPAGRLRSEADPLQPVSHYGQSKLSGELAARSFADRVPISVVRPPIVFGEGDPATFEMFRAIKRSRIHFVPGSGKHAFSLVYAGDLADLLIRAADHGERLPAGKDGADSPGRGCYFAASSEHPTYAELGRLLGRALGYGHIFCLRCGPMTVRTVAAVSEWLGRLRGRAVYLSTDKIREALAGSWACSAAKAASQLGFAPAQPLADRLRQTADWYRAQGWL
jgi:nucleoside-diphosphate-sugar epimerase